METPTGLCLPGTVGPESISFLVDCGSAITIISDEVWNKIEESQKGKLEKGPVACTANNQKLTVLGSVRVRLEFGNWIVSQDVCVVKDLNNDGILGLDFLSKHGGMVDFRTKTLRINGRVYPLNEACKKKVIARVVIAEDMELPPQHEVFFTARVDQEVAWIQKIDTGILNPNSKFVEKTGVITARVLSNIRNGFIPVKSINPSPTPVKLYKGMEIGTFCELEDADSIKSTFEVEPELHGRVNPVANVTTNNKSSLIRNDRRRKELGNYLVQKMRRSTTPRRRSC